MVRTLKLKAKDSEALKEFLTRLRAELGEKLIELKLFGSKARGRIRGNPISMSL